MIPDAPADVDIRALIAVEQLSQLADRAGWSEPDDPTAPIIWPVVTLFDREWEVIKHQVLTVDSPPAVWVHEWARVYGALIDVSEHLALTVEGSSTILDGDRLVRDMEGDGSECPIEDQHGTEPCSWCSRVKVEAVDPYLIDEGQVRLIHLFSKDAATVTLVHTRATDAKRWVPAGHGDSVDRAIELFERLMVGFFDDNEGGEQ